MLGRIASGVKTGAKATAYGTVTMLALGTAYTAYEFIDGGADRVRDRFAPVAERYDAARDRAEAKWEKVGAWTGRQVERAEENPEQALWLLLPVLLTVLYYRSKGHKTSDAILAAVTRTAPAPVPGEPTVLSRAQARLHRKQLQEDEAELVRRMAALPKEVEAARKAMEKAKDETQGAREMLDLCEQVEDEAVAKYARLTREQETAGETLAKIGAELAELNKVA